MTSAVTPEGDRIYLHDRPKVCRPNLSKIDVRIREYRIFKLSEMHLCPDESLEERRDSRTGGMMMPLRDCRNVLTLVPGADEENL